MIIEQIYYYSINFSISEILHIYQFNFRVARCYVSDVFVCVCLFVFRQINADGLTEKCARI